MKRVTLIFSALLLSFPLLTAAADYGKLIESVDTEKAADSVDTDKLSEAVEGTDTRTEGNQTLQDRTGPYHGISGRKQRLPT